MDDFIINLNENSAALVNCLLYANNNDEEDLLMKIMKACSELDKKKKFFSWNNINDAIDYLEKIKKASMFVWFYFIYNIIDNVDIDYTYKILVKPEWLEDAAKARDKYKEKHPEYFN